MHWDMATQEVFGGRPIPKPAPDDKDYFGPPGKPPLTNFVRKSTVEQAPKYPERKDSGPYVVGDWEDWVEPELKSWSADKEVHPLDQNYFLAERMQGAVRNNNKIFRVLSGDNRDENGEIDLIDQISYSYIATKDEKGNRLAKPLMCLNIRKAQPPDTQEPATKSHDSHAPSRQWRQYWRPTPWKLIPFVLKNSDGEFRVWWRSIGKAKATTDTARLREEYALSQKTQFEHAVLIREVSPLVHTGFLKGRRRTCTNTYGLLWFINASDLPFPTKEEKAERNRILKGYRLPELKIGTRETREIPTIRRTTKGRSIRVEHDSTSGVKINTLRQREIRRTRQTKKKTQYAEGELLSKYVDNRPSPNVDLLCRGGCFALVRLHHLELKYLGPYSTTVTEVFAALDLERRKSVRSALKYERKAARRKGLSNEVVQERIDRRRTRIDRAFDHAEVFRRPHCIDHGQKPLTANPQ
jgi:hypothetical protein